MHRMAGFSEWLKMVLIFYLMSFGYQLLPR